MASDAGCQLGSQPGPQAASPAPSPVSLVARRLGSETEKPKRTRRGLHQLSRPSFGSRMAALAQSSEASGILGRESRLHETGGGGWQGHIVRSEREMEDSVLAVLENPICHTMPNE